MKKVLVVVDNPVLAEEMVEAVHSAGHWPISRARCYQSALAAVDGNTINTAIVDLSDQNGGDVARALREQFGIDIILVADEDHASKPLMDVEHCFIRKPVDAAVIAQLVGPTAISKAA